jgi:hypothetical protein
VDALKENPCVMCAAFPTSIDVCEAQVEISHTHDILCYCGLSASIRHDVLTFNARLNVSAINCPNAILVTTVLLEKKKKQITFTIQNAIDICLFYLNKKYDLPQTMDNSGRYVQCMDGAVLSLLDE